MACAHDVERRDRRRACGSGIAVSMAVSVGLLYHVPFLPPAPSIGSHTGHASCQLQHSRPDELRGGVRRRHRRSAAPACAAPPVGARPAARRRAGRGPVHWSRACAPTFALTEAELLPPVPGGEKILCIGVNYANRDAELTAAGGNRGRQVSQHVLQAAERAGRTQPADPASAGIRAARIRGRDRAGDRQDRRGASRRSARSNMSPASRCATRAPSATGSGTAASTSRRARAGTRPAASARG